MRVGLLRIAAFACLACVLTVRADDPAGKPASDHVLKAVARSREMAGGEPRHVRAVERPIEWDLRKTAVVVCDMWDRHWCPTSTERVAEMAPRMNEVLKEARRRGALIIHCPSDTMEFYKDHPGRKLAQAAPVVEPKVPLQRWCHLDPKLEGSLPIDDRDGGCDCGEEVKPHRAWSRQIETLEVMPGDAITDSAEAYYLMRQRGVENVVVMGVHTNMCVLGRPFSIRQLVAQGLNVVLMRDMTDTMYNPASAPQVSHFTGTDYVVEHIERYWCPTITSADLLGGRPFRFAKDRRKRLVMLVDENEYGTERTLPAFAKAHLGRDFQVEILESDWGKEPRFPHLHLLKEADVLLVSVRRQVFPAEQMKLIREFVASGKGVVGLRTASHAFALRNAVPPEGRADWPEFDRDVLRGNYQMHHPNDKHPVITAVAPQNAILAGIDTTGWKSPGSLYRNHPLPEGVTVLLEGWIEGVEQREPVAWTTLRKDGGRTFYTSLGHSGDFDSTQFKTLLRQGIAWAAGSGEAGANEKTTSVTPSAGSTTAVVKAGAPLSPAESLGTFKLAPDLAAEVVLAEPDITQPVFMNFDARGRLWVMEYRQYPEPAGLTLLSKDRFFRAVYDRVPEAPPKGLRGADRISIHEDSDGNGSFDRHSVFLDGLNIATSFAQGRGGVWVLNPPFLLFYPDRDGDDRPDGDPEVHLSGFGLEDTHSVVNSLRFGPDGWLYACQGSTVTGNVTTFDPQARPVKSQGQHIWRYHPETRRYEVFSEGGGNAFGCEFDAAGRVFSGHNGGNTRGFHYMQGAYLQKGFNKHGPLSNPYAFGYFPAMSHPQTPRFTHHFVVYEGDGLPDAYQGKLFAIAPLLHHVVVSERLANGSTFGTKDVGMALESADTWFRPVDLKDGPDGNLYVADWYDGQLAHTANAEHGLDRERGRIIRLRAQGKDRAGSRLPAGGMERLPTDALVRLLSHPNRWHRQTAVRVLGDRRDPAAFPSLVATLRERKAAGNVDALWGLYQSGGLTDELAIELMSHPDPQIRLWTVRLAADAPAVGSDVLAAMVAVASSETHVEVRSQLAASARRLPPASALTLVGRLIEQTGAAADERLPLQLWWAVERVMSVEPDAVIGWLSGLKLWDEPLLRAELLPRIARRLAATGQRADLDRCVALLNSTSDREARVAVVRGVEEAFRGRSARQLPPELAAALAEYGGNPLLLKLRQRQASAVETARAVLADEKAPSAKRVEIAGVFGELGVPETRDTLRAVLRQTADDGVKAACIRALGVFPDDEIGDELLAAYGTLQEDHRQAVQDVLATRPGWSRALLAAVARGAVPAETVSTTVARQMTLHSAPEVQASIRRLFPDLEGATTEAMNADIDRLRQVAAQSGGSPYAGKRLFAQHCGQCHRLHEVGGEVGPDLTPFKRQDLSALIPSIVNPSLEIREGYETQVAVLDDGRVLTGTIVEQDPQRVTLRTPANQTLTFERSQLESMTPQARSLMPDRLLQPLKEQEVKDLFAYLRSTQPLAD